MGPACGGCGATKPDQPACGGCGAQKTAQPACGGCGAKKLEQPAGSTCGAQNTNTQPNNEVTNASKSPTLASLSTQPSTKTLAAATEPQAFCKTAAKIESLCASVAATIASVPASHTDKNLVVTAPKSAISEPVVVNQVQ